MNYWSLLFREKQIRKVSAMDLIFVYRLINFICNIPAAFSSIEVFNEDLRASNGFRLRSLKTVYVHTATVWVPSCKKYTNRLPNIRKSSPQYGKVWLSKYCKARLFGFYRYCAIIRGP